MTNPIRTWQNRIEEELKKFSSELSSSPAELYEPLKYALAHGGKRIRPLFALLACDLMNGNIEDALSSALGIELFHNFTLIHDDIMDNAPLRRNHPSVHHRWNINTAILSGDMLLIKVFSFFSCSLLPENTSEKIRKEFMDTAARVCEGQQWDLLYQQTEHVSVLQYMKMIELKTASLFGASMKIGVWCAGGNDAAAQTMYDFGCKAGMAFQLQDDLLDVYGKAETLGKKHGGDILENKKTFLLLKAKELTEMNRYKKEELEQWRSFQPSGEKEELEKVEAIKKIYDFTNVKKITEEKIHSFLMQAFALLDSSALAFASAEKKNLLKTFISSVYK